MYSSMDKRDQCHAMRNEPGTTLRRMVMLSGWMLMGMMQSNAYAASIVVYGGNGNIGSRVVTEALNRGHAVTVVSRSAPEQTQASGRPASVKGDILDTAGVTRLIAGKDVVISVINGRDASLFTNAATSVVSAIKANGKSAPRLIWLGGASSLEVAPGKRMIDTMPGASGSRLGHTQVLDYLRTLSDVQWTFVSPSMEIMPGKRTGKFRIGGDQLLRDERGESRISIEDFAVAVVDEIEKPRHLHKRFTVGY